MTEEEAVFGLKDTPMSHTLLVLPREVLQIGKHLDILREFGDVHLRGCFAVSDCGARLDVVFLDNENVAPETGAFQQNISGMQLDMVVFAADTHPTRDQVCFAMSRLRGMAEVDCRGVIFLSKK